MMEPQKNEEKKDIIKKKVQILKPEMISRADELIDKVNPKLIPIIRFSELKKEIPYGGIVDELNAESMLGKCTELVEKSNDYAKISRAFALEAKRRKDLQYQKIFTTVPKEVEGSKTTDKAKQALADQDPDVVKYQLLENAWTIMAAYFETMHDDMKDRFYWFKRIFEYQKKIYGGPANQ